MAEVPPVARAMGRIPSGLFILTTGAGEETTGCLVSFVQQVGFAPPAICVALQRERHVAAAVRAHAGFCIAVISKSSKSLLGHFAPGFGPGQEIFDGVETRDSEIGTPYPALAHAYLACRVIGESSWTDHTLFCGEVVGGACNDDDMPLVHVRRNGMQY